MRDMACVCKHAYMCENLHTCACAEREAWENMFSLYLPGGQDPPALAAYKTEESLRGSDSFFKHEASYHVTEVWEYLTSGLL